MGLILKYKTFNKDDSINHAHVEKVIDELRRQLLDLTKKNNFGSLP